MWLGGQLHVEQDLCEGHEADQVQDHLHLHHQHHHHHSRPARPCSQKVLFCLRKTYFFGVHTFQQRKNLSLRLSYATLLVGATDRRTPRVFLCGHACTPKMYVLHWQNCRFKKVLFNTPDTMRMMMMMMINMMMLMMMSMRMTMVSIMMVVMN